MKRPAVVTSLLWMVLCLVVWNAIRLFTTLAHWDVLQEFAPRPGPFYIFGSASFWTLSWLAVWRGLLLRSLRAQRHALPAALGYAAWWWLDRLLLQAPRPNWPFALGVTVIILAITTALIYHPRTNAYFQQRENNEPTTQDQESA